MKSVQHKGLHEGQWAEMPFSLQMANIGSEVSRMIRWRNKGNADRSEKAFFRALELIDLSIETESGGRYETDNREETVSSGHLKELCRAREELCGYYLETGSFDYDSEQIRRYYDQFALLDR